MNRLVTENPEGVTPDQLPPAGASGRFRVLFLTSFALGFRTLSRQLEAYMAGRDDVDAVHARLQLPGRLSTLGRGAGKLRGWDLWGYRRMLLWRAYLPRLLGGPLDVRRFDAVCVTTQGNAMAMPSVRRRTGVPYGVYIDATTAQYCRELGGSRVPEWPCHLAEKRIFGSADVVAGMSRWTLDSARDDCGVPETKLQVVHNAVPVPAALPPRPEQAGKVRLAIVGNDWVRKGGPRLVAWHQARWAERAELHVFGAGVPADHLMRGVVWHGPVEHGRLMNELLPSMDVFVLPTRSDMSPWAAIEAAGRGLPVVSSRLGAIPEIVLDGRTGFLCRPDDDAEFIAAVERLMGDAPLRRAMSAAAHAHARAEFSPEVSYGGLIDRLKAAAAAAGRKDRGL